MDLEARLAELSRISGAATPVVSVYLNTRWADEHQRERARVFLKNELARARAAYRGVLDSDLDWIEAQGRALVEQALFPEAHGVALFACGVAGLREILPVRVPFEDAFVVADTPFLGPLAAVHELVPTAVIVFVDAESGRLVPVSAEGPGPEVALESDVPGHHRRGGWAQLAQSRYQRHIQDHRGRHFEAVSAALTHLVEGQGVKRIVLAGEPRNVAEFTKHVPERIADRITGTIAGTRHEPAHVLVERASDLLVRADLLEEAAAVDRVLVEAAKGGRAVAGLEGVLAAAGLGAIHVLYLLRSFREPGRACGECGALQPGETAACRVCRRPTKPVELGAALVDRVLATGGAVEAVELHAELARAGGVAARLRYSL